MTAQRIRNKIRLRRAIRGASITHNTLPRAMLRPFRAHAQSTAIQSPDLRIPRRAEWFPRRAQRGQLCEHDGRIARHGDSRPPGPGGQRGVNSYRREKIHTLLSQSLRPRPSRRREQGTFSKRCRVKSWDAHTPWNYSTSMASSFASWADSTRRRWAPERKKPRLYGNARAQEILECYRLCDDVLRPDPRA